MADNSCKIENFSQGKGVSLNLPPFPSINNQLTPEVKAIEEIDSIRIHVERAIGTHKEYRLF